MVISELGASNYVLSIASTCGNYTSELSTIDLNALAGSASADDNSIEFVEGTTGVIVLHATVENATSIIWMLGDVVIGEGSTLNYDVTAGGNYNFTMIASNDNCELIDEVEVVAQTTVGLSESLSAEISVVRGDGGVQISFNGVSASGCNVSIFNTAGQIVYEKQGGVSAGQSIFVDMDGLAQGVYTVRISEKGQLLKVASVSK
jgi:hypothetical protein